MKALIIDDLPDNRLIFDKMLCSLGFADNELVESPRVFMNWLKTNPMRLHEFDVVLMDIMMPEMNGLDISRLLKKSPQFRDIPIVVVSAQIDERVKELASNIGCQYYLKKPVTLNDMRFVKTIAESYSQVKEKKMQLVKELSEINSLKLRVEDAFKKIASSQSVSGIRFENSYEDFVARDWRYAVADKEIFSGLLFDFEWNHAEAEAPEDFEYFVKLLLKRAVLVVSEKFKNVPVRFIHGSTVEFYIHLPQVKEAETIALTELLHQELTSFIHAREEYRGQLKCYFSHLTLIPQKKQPIQSFMNALRSGLLIAKSSGTPVLDAAVGELKKAS